MKNSIIAIIIALLIYSPISATINKSKKEAKKFKIQKELQGFEMDYLTNNIFKTKAEKKQFWGIVEIIVNFVASWFSTSYGKYDQDTQNEKGSYFLFDRTPGAKTLEKQLIIKL
jgi:hypothetical protein